MHMHHQRDSTVRFSIQPLIMATTTRTPSKSPSEQRPTLHRLIESARKKQIHELFRLAESGAKQWHQVDKWAGGGGTLRKIYKKAARKLAGTDGSA